MTITSTNTPVPFEDELSGTGLDDAVRNYVRTYVLWHGRRNTMEKFGASRHTLWRFLERGHLGKSLLEEAVKAIGDDPDTIQVAAWAITAVRQVR